MGQLDQRSLDLPPARRDPPGDRRSRCQQYYLLTPPLTDASGCSAYSDATARSPTVLHEFALSGQF